jgi:hypothetical protein
MGLFLDNQEKARNLFIEYMNQDSNETFMDLAEEEEEMDEEKAKELYQTMLRKRGIVTGIGGTVPVYVKWEERQFFRIAKSIQ